MIGELAGLLAVAFVMLVAAGSAPLFLVAKVKRKIVG